MFPLSADYTAGVKVWRFQAMPAMDNTPASFARLNGGLNGTIGMDRARGCAASLNQSKSIGDTIVL